MLFDTVATLSQETYLLVPARSGQVVRFNEEEVSTTAGRAVRLRGDGDVLVNRGSAWSARGRFPIDYEGPYFDGDTPGTPLARYEWDGAPHASTSSGYELVTSAAGSGDAPSLVKGQTPTSVVVNYSNPSLPARSARYTLASYSESVEFFVPKPPGESLTFRVWGFRTGTAAVSVNGTELIPTASGVSAVIPDGGAFIKLTGVGDITLAGMRVSTDPSNEWKPGRGHSGCAIEGKPQITTYSAGLDLMGMSAKFVEVGAWL